MTRRTPKKEPEFVAQARAAQLSERCIHLSAALRERHPTDASTVEQPSSDLLQVYTQARALAGSFAERLSAAQWPAGAVAQVRPSGVKRLDRMVEKLSLIHI